MVATIFDNKIVAKSYDFAISPIVKKRQDLIANELKTLPAGSNIFEFGVGTGLILTDLVKRFGFNATGVDSSICMLKKAQERVDQANLQSKVTLLHYEGNKLDVPSNNFDAIVMSYVLTSNPPMTMYHHVTEFSRLLKKNGKMLILDVFIPFASCPYGFIVKGKSKGLAVEKLSWPPGQFLLVMIK